VPPADVRFSRDRNDGEGVVRAPARENAAGVGERLESRNLFAVAEQLAGRAATPSTRRQYSAIYRSFGDWLRSELGRPPVVGDLEGDVIGAYARYLETAGGRGGRPAALATRRIYLSMIRALARELGREQVAGGVKVPRHRAGPPETITESDYQSLLRVPDCRGQIGRRDHALTARLGGLRAPLGGAARADRPRSAPAPGQRPPRTPLRARQVRQRTRSPAPRGEPGGA
jgi:hypothetical protein